MLFFKHFNLTWILMLEYVIKDKLIGNVNIPYFGHQTKIKWWSGMNIANHGKDKGAKWFTNNPTLCNKSSDQSKFLMAKSKNQAKIAAASTSEELMKIAEEMKKTMISMSQKDLKSENQDDDDLLDEDDPTKANSYFGHDLSQYQRL